MNQISTLKKIKVLSDYNGWRVDKFLATIDKSSSRSLWQKTIKNEGITISDVVISSPKYKITTDEIIEINNKPQDSHTISLPAPCNIPLDILFEDEYILVINKSPGMVVHPGDGGETNTVVNALLYKYANHAIGQVNFADNFDDKQRPGIVHRLDKDTSGTLIIAKNQEILTILSDEFKNRSVEKKYFAIIHGHPKKTFDTINLNIGRHPVNRKKMAVVENGKNAITHYTVEKSGTVDNSPISLLHVKIETGRTHQIRVHLSHLHMPVVGDSLYGGAKRKPYAKRQMLHASELTIKHPVTNKIMTFTSPEPEDFLSLIKNLPASNEV